MTKLGLEETKKKKKLMNTATAERGRLKMEMWGIFICKGISFLFSFFN